jgi:hypothetical protein
MNISQKAMGKGAISMNQADPFCCAPAWQLSFHDVFSPKHIEIISVNLRVTNLSSVYVYRMRF